MIVSVQAPVTNGKNPRLWSPAVIVVGEKKISDLTITANAGIREAAFEKLWNWQFTCDGKYALTKDIDVFAEYFSQFARHAQSQHNIDGGILYHICPSLMLHLSAGTTLVQGGDKFYFLSAGFAVHM